MIALDEQAIPLDAYAQETLNRLPLADATVSLWAQVLEPRFMAQIFAEYRGRSFADTLTFARLVELMGDALVTHEGSGRQSFARAQEHGTLPTSSEAVYGKLRRVPLSLSLGFFTEGTARLGAVLPAQPVATALPASGADLTVGGGRARSSNGWPTAYCPRGERQGKAMEGSCWWPFCPRRGGPWRWRRIRMASATSVGWCRRSWSKPARW